MSLTFDIYVQNDLENMSRSATLLLLTLSDLLWPDLTLTFKYDLHTRVVPSLETYASTLEEFELFSVSLTGPRSQNLKTLHFDLWPELDLKRDINIQILSMD